MSKNYYSDYVNHMLRFYCKNVKLDKFKTEVDKINHKACEKVMSSMSDESRNIVIVLFTNSEDSLNMSVNNVSKNYNLPTNYIWTMLSKISHDIAKARKLL